MVPTIGNHGSALSRRETLLSLSSFSPSTSHALPSPISSAHPLVPLTYPDSCLSASSASMSVPTLPSPVSSGQPSVPTYPDAFFLHAMALACAAPATSGREAMVPLSPANPIQVQPVLAQDPTLLDERPEMLVGEPNGASLVVSDTITTNINHALGAEVTLWRSRCLKGEMDIRHLMSEAKRFEKKNEKLGGTLTRLQRVIKWEKDVTLDLFRRIGDLEETVEDLKTEVNVGSSAIDSLRTQLESVTDKLAEVTSGRDRVEEDLEIEKADRQDGWDEMRRLSAVLKEHRIKY
ncbi:hypothetical protein JAAARDRAFT_187302 [Jaapia argillacea MUCL 33604]|uniref:Uncharacterized protein n=1 Tax=Jaapia argillacea MUCL 33604 TaxID=933084 RepID=A0A067QCM9_9AGAM|nr:hypothetical protein JAAARDRAFT_187302 [Jaapia argillacea MUCL 33604]